MKKSYIIAVVISFIVILILIAWIFNIKQDLKLQTIPAEIKTTKQKIDSVSNERTNEISDFTKRSENDAKKSTEIIKSIQHEKIIVRDTSYAAMCKYIEDYRSE